MLVKKTADSACEAPSGSGKPKRAAEALVLLESPALVTPLMGRQSLITFAQTGVLNKRSGSLWEGESSSGDDTEVV